MAVGGYGPDDHVHGSGQLRKTMSLLPMHPLTLWMAVMVTDQTYSFAYAAVAHQAYSSMPKAVKGGCAPTFLVGLVAPT